MTFLIPLLVKWGVPEPLRVPLQWLLVALAAGALFMAGKAIYDASVIDDYETERTIEAIDAHNTAAEERSADDTQNFKIEEEAHDVIEASPGGEVSPAARALACLRLRRLGRIPAACRSEGSDGSEAGTE